MNKLLEHHGEVLDDTQQLRRDLLDVLTDADLQFTPAGNNPPLGELLREMGQFEQMYATSFKTYVHDWSYRYPDPTIATSVPRLKAWFAEMEAALRAALEAMSDDDLERPISGRGGFNPSVVTQFHVYREMLFIYYGRLDVYRRGLGKTVSEQWRDWIG
jgi:hypothetical protein